LCFMGRIGLLVSHCFLCVALLPNAVHGLLILEVSRSNTTTHQIRHDSSGRVISSSQRPLPDNTRHSQQTNIYALAGIRNVNFSRRAAVNLSLRPRGHWDLLSPISPSIISGLGVRLLTDVFITVVNLEIQLTFEVY